MNKETWKDIENYEGYYQVSNLGRIKSLERIVLNRNANYRVKEMIRKQHIGTTGYYMISLVKDCKTKTFKVHRFIGKAFMPNPLNKCCINHIDGNKLNNDLSNLEWCTYSENAKHAFKIGLRNMKNVEQPIQQLKNGEVIATFKSHHEASRQTGVNRGNISYCLSKFGDNKTGGYEWRRT